MGSKKAVHNPHFPRYVTPSTGVFRLVPSTWIPYVELMRLHVTAGIYSAYLPHMVGTLWVAACRGAEVSPQQLLYTNLILFAGTIFMRGAAVTFNDIVDQEYDRHVARCSIRPIARGAVSTAQGYAFTGTLSLIASVFLLQLPPDCLVVAAPSIFLLWLYPFTKRFTDYPQLLLGFQMSLFLFMGIVAMGVPAKQAFSDVSAWSLYTAFVAWTVVYDTVYARQDVRDDEKAGVRSMAVRFAGQTMTLLSAFAALEVGGLILTGMLSDLGWIYFSIGCGGTALGVVTMLVKVKLDDPADCFWWFRNAYWSIGVPLGGGLLLEYLNA